MPSQCALLPRLRTLCLLSLAAALVAACSTQGEATAQPAATAPAGPAAFVWWEAENPAAGNFLPADQNPFKPNNAAEADVLSAGAWIGVPNQRKDVAFLEYDVAAPDDGVYSFWARKFWKHGPFRWRFDNMDWQQCGRDIVLADNAALRLHTGANWVNLGQVKLAKGPHRLRIELTQTDGAACFDCFVLTTTPFVPRGKLKPGESYGRQMPGWFAYEPAPDDFAESPIDLRRLNHREAGEFGFAQRRNKDVIFEKEGKPVRFWGVTSGESTFEMDDDGMRYLARRLAKNGVNLVRLHVDFDDTEPNHRLERIQKFVAELKKEGIYSYIGFYCSAVARVRDKWNLPELKTGDRIQGILFCYPPLQERYRQWAKCLFGTVNPYTGLPLARDPALVGIELMDEDNWFFWTFKPYQSPPAVVMPYLEKAFGQWLVKKHGSLEKALAAWGPAKPPKQGKDDTAAGRIALYDTASLTSADWAVTGRNPARAADTAAFLTEHLRDFWATTGQWLRDNLGYKGLVIGTNWKTADDRVLGPLDKYTLRAGDATAENNYYGGATAGEPKIHPYGAGNWYRDTATVRDPINPVFMTAQFADMPHFWTEGTWCTPNRFRAEMPLLLAGYFSLQGIDSLMLFAVERDICATLPKWPVQTPACMGQFPAAALIYRMGYVAEGPIAVNEALKLSDLYALKGSAFGKPAGLDEAQAVHVPAGANVEAPSGTSVDPLVFYTGRVVRTIGESPGDSSALDSLPRLIDRRRKIVTSATGQLALDWGRGISTIDTSRAQAATGFLKSAGAIKLADVTIEGASEFAAVAVVALDDRPLRESRRMLLQVMTEEESYGWKTRPATTQQSGRPVDIKVIETMGYPPLMVRRIAGTVTLAGPVKATPLDANGKPAADPVALPTGQITLQPTAMYYLLERP